MTLNDITKAQEVLRKDIHKSFKNGNVRKTISLIDTFATFTERFNNILRDDFIEEIIIGLSEQYITSKQDIENGGDKNTIVMYDQIGSSICLSIQYLRGLAACGYKIIYIYENYNYNAKINDNLLSEVKKYSSEYHLISSRRLYDNGVFLGNTIRQIIIDANPSKILVHPQATGALGMSVMYSIHGAKKFRVVPGDHHFYLGYECFDKFIEFRPFGWSTAIYERKIPAEKIVNLNYYPIIDEFTPFGGFPDETKDKVIIASGGAGYKFLSSDFFYEAVERILVENKNVVFLFIGTPTIQMRQLFMQENMKNRIFLLGYRRDFAAVIKHIDILFNSYPFSGGLFCQTAAKFSKPILAYTTKDMIVENSVEDILCVGHTDQQVAITSKEDFFQYAKRLIDDKQYRQEKGEFLNSILQTEENFNHQLNSILNEEYPTLQSQNVEYVDRSQRINQYIYIRNNYNFDYLAVLSAEYRLSVFYKFWFLIKEMKKDFKYIVMKMFTNCDVIRNIIGR